jgi:membrane-bound metal-dependent hydrolase YbcI (DUF457 family)
MILFGHLGLTYAAVAVAEKGGIKGKLEKFNKYIDYRLVFIGSILPDLIDKLIIFLIGDGTIHSGRIFAHSLLFTLLITGAGLLIWKKSKKPWLLTLAFCCLVHLLLDSMWLYPNALFWPLYDIFRTKSYNSPGDVFQVLSLIIRQDFNSVSILSLKDALSNLIIGIPELTGFIIMVYLSIRLIIRKQLKAFLKTGKLEI